MNARIAHWRQKAGLSRLQLAEMVGVTIQAVGQWERGDTQPSLASLARITSALGISMAEFYGPLPKREGKA